MQPEAQWFALPPIASGVAWRGELVVIEHGADVARRFLRKGIGAKKTEGAGVVVKEIPDEVERPRVLVGRSHGGEPHLPIQAGLVGSNLDRTAMETDGKGLVGIGLPEGAVVGSGSVSSFEDDIETLLADAAEGAVSIDKVEWIKGGVHDLMGRNHIDNRLNAQEGDQRGQGPRGAEQGAAGLGVCGGGFGAAGEGARKEAAPAGVVETGEGRDEGEPVEEGKIAAGDECQLKGDHDGASGAAERWSQYYAPRRYKISQKVEQDPGSEHPTRQKMKEAAERIWDGLRFEVIVEGGQVAPGGI